MRKGFTLVELLIYSLIFAGIALTLAYTLSVFLRISGQQIASAEVANQANFILQRIQYETSRAGFLVVNDEEFSDAEDDEKDSALNTGRSRLVIKARAEGAGPPNDPNSPIVFYKNGSQAVMKIGNNGPVSLNSSRVLVDTLTFTKISTPPGRDTVQVNLILRYNSQRAGEQIVRQFLLGIGKATAATFDTPIETALHNTSDIGAIAKRWRDLFLQGTLDVAGTAKLGTDSTAIGQLIHGSATFNIPSTAAGATYTKNIIVSGAVNNSKIFVTAPKDLAGNFLLKGAKANDGNIDIAIYNAGGGSASDATNRTWHYLILR